MNRLEFVFWLCAGIIFYSFLGYGLVLLLWSVLKKQLPAKRITNNSFEPPVTLIIPCYNEAGILEQKIRNCTSLIYPSGKLHLLFITDGSSDHSVELLKKYPEILLLHAPERRGKTAAENRAMRYVKTPFVIFSDANTLLNPDAIRQLVKHFADERTGCAAGEKRIHMQRADNAGTAGEGLYWRYESFLKKLDSDCNTALGAAGELVAFRTSLYRHLLEDTLLDDFMQSMQIAAAGYRIVYEPAAYATETASASVTEELKRKIRIATGNWQALTRLSGILSIRRTPLLYFQYFSQRVLRRAVTPFLLILLLLLNIPLAMLNKPVYQVLLVAQCCFYAMAVAGHVLRNRKTRFKILFVPYYLCVMHYAVLAGLQRHLSGKQQNGLWEKVKRNRE